MSQIIINPIASEQRDHEVVERKGLGHPDTICDALAETFSRNLCKAYLERFGHILHHNVDKALLIGGRAAPAFGGGRVLAPMEIILAGRATGEVDGIPIFFEDIAVEGSRDWLRNNFHALDPQRYVRISTRVNAGSQNLRALFGRGSVPLANDTSIGVGYAPLSPLESLVLEIESHIQARDRNHAHPAWGEDIKVMAVRRGPDIDLTIACAMVDRYLGSLDDYLDAKTALREHVAVLARSRGFERCSISINAADDSSSGQVYLTVTGTSAEAGDDGEVGRGNRVNGLITPLRSMSLEAAAGKNPRSHVGKLYNIAAGRIAAALVDHVPAIREAQCLLVSRIGAPIAEPAFIELRISEREGPLSDRLRQDAREIVDSQLKRLPSLTNEFVAGTMRLF